MLVFVGVCVCHSTVPESYEERHTRREEITLVMKPCSAVWDLMQEKMSFFNALHTSMLDSLQTGQIIEEKREGG
jgi:hypothetical protein